MSTFEYYDTPPRFRPRVGAMAWGDPLSERQEIELAAEALEIFAEEELEEFVDNVLAGVAAGAGKTISGPIARELGDVLEGMGPAGLPTSGALSSLAAPGRVVGSKLGWMIGRLLELELEGMDREDAELERARRYVGLAATSARHAALAPRDAPPRDVVQTALAEALSEHVPELLESAIAGDLSPYAKVEGLVDPPDVGAKKPFTAAQRKKIIAANMKRNGGTLKTDAPGWDPYENLTDWNPAMPTIDHIVPMSVGGTNSYKNARVISAHYNLTLRAKTAQDIKRVKNNPKLNRGFPPTIWRGHPPRKPTLEASSINW